jgi:SlyX protein
MDSGAPMFLVLAIRHTGAMPDRLDAIEEKLAHLERALAEISDVVARQQKELDRALDRNQRLMEKVAALESDVGPGATAHEKPPHY